MVHGVDRGRHTGWEIARMAREQAGAMSRQAREVVSGGTEAPEQGEGQVQPQHAPESTPSVLEPAPATTVSGLVVQSTLQAGGGDTIIIEGNANDLNWITQAGGNIIDRGNDTIIIRGNANDVNIITQAAGDIIDEGDDTIIIEGNANDINWVTQTVGTIRDNSDDLIYIRGNNNEVNILSQSGVSGAPDAVAFLVKVNPGEARRLRQLLEQQFRAVTPESEKNGRPVQPWEIASKEQLVLEAYLAEASKQNRGQKRKLKVSVDTKL